VPQIACRNEKSTRLCQVETCCRNSISDIHALQRLCEDLYIRGFLHTFIDVKEHSEVNSKRANKYCPPALSDMD